MGLELRGFQCYQPSAERGHLGLQKIEIVTHELLSGRSGLAKRFEDFHSPALETPLGKQVLVELEKRKDVQLHDGRLLLQGAMPVRFEVRMLALWYMWFANRVGKSLADEALDNFLSATHVDAVAAVAVEGLNLDCRVDVDSDLRLAKVDQLPECNLKDYVFRLSAVPNCIGGPISGMFLIGTVRVPKFVDSDEQHFSVIELFGEWFQKAERTALLLNCLPRIAALPTLQGSLVGERTPFGPFALSSMGTYVHGRTVNTFATTATTFDLCQLKGLASQFGQMDRIRAAAFDRALTRLAYCKIAEKEADAALELGIALEMMLLPDNPRYKVSKKFRNRGARLLEPVEGKSRDQMRDTLEFIYDCRSEVAHGGLLSEANRARFRDNRLELQSVGEMVATRLIMDHSASGVAGMLHR